GSVAGSSPISRGRKRQIPISNPPIRMSWIVDRLNEGSDDESVRRTGQPRGTSRARDGQGPGRSWQLPKRGPRLGRALGAMPAAEREYVAAASLWVVPKKPAPRQLLSGLTCN